MKRLSLIAKRAITTLIETTTIPVDEVIRRVTEKAATIPQRESWGTDDGTPEVFVDDAVEVSFLAELLREHIPDRRPGRDDGKDIDYSFDAQPVPLSAQLAALGTMAAEAQATYDANRGYSILDGTAAPTRASDTGFSSANASFAAATDQPVAKTAPSPVAKGPLGPTGAPILPPILRSAHAMAELAAAASYQIAKAVAASSPVAKAGPSKLTLKIVKAGA